MSHLEILARSILILIILYLLTKQAQKWSTDTFHVLIEPLTVSIGRAGVSEEDYDGFLPWLWRCSILYRTMISFLWLKHVDVILLNRQRIGVFDSQPFGGSGKGSTLFIIASLMHELNKRHNEEHLIPPKIKRSSSFADSVLFSQPSIESDLKTNSSYRIRADTDEFQKDKDKEHKMVFSSCMQLYVSLLNQLVVSCEELLRRDTYGNNACPDAVRHISNLLGVEGNIRLEDEEAFYDVRLAIAKTTINFLVDAPASSGLLLTDAFLRLNLDFHGKCVPDDGNTKLEAMQIEGIKMLTVLLSSLKRKFTLRSKSKVAIAI